MFLIDAAATGVTDALTVDANTATAGNDTSATVAAGDRNARVTPSLMLVSTAGTRLTSAAATINVSEDRVGERLTVNVLDTGLTQNYNASTNTLTLTGNASVGDYQRVLRTLRYHRPTSETSNSNREIAIRITDSAIAGNNTSAAAIVDVALADGAVTIAAPADVTVEAGSPLWVTFDLDNPLDRAVTYNATIGDGNIVSTQFATGQSLRFSIASPDATTGGQATPLSGDLTFQLFETLSQRATERLTTLTNDDFYDGLTFHRVVPNFVIQGGDPTGNGTGGSQLGDFDDQFDVRLQHNRAGLLSYAKSIDDTNDSQFFVTDGPTRNLDFQHTIAGVLTSGETLRDALNAVDNSGQPSNRPTQPVTITEAEIFQDNDHGAILINAPNDATGTTTVVVTVQDSAGNTRSQTINVTVVAPDSTDLNTNGNPFLDDIPTLTGTHGLQATYQLTSQDSENDAVRYLDRAAIEQINASDSVNDKIRFPGDLADSTLTYSVDPDTGLITYTPGDSSTPDEVTFLVGVAPTNKAIVNSTVDLQVITLQVDNGTIE